MIFDTFGPAFCIGFGFLYRGFLGWLFDAKMASDFLKAVLDDVFSGANPRHLPVSKVRL